MSLLRRVLFRVLPVALAGSAAACQPGRNPVLQVPIPPVHLNLKGRVVSDSGTPIYALVALLRLARKGPADTVRSTTAPDGRFQFDSLMPGAYALDTRSLGYYRRRDTLALSASPGLEVILQLRSTNMCLDLCPPDPLVAAAARARQPSWQCDREKKSIDVVRRRWGEFLSDSMVRGHFHPELSASQIARQLHRVGDDAVCRRLAIALFPQGTSLAYTLFRWPPYWLLSDPYFGNAVVVNDSLRPLAASYGGGFAFWIAESGVP